MAPPSGWDVRLLARLAAATHPRKPASANWQTPSSPDRWDARANSILAIPQTQILRRTRSHPRFSCQAFSWRRSRLFLCEELLNLAR